MKMIIAVIRPEKLQAVKDALKDIGVKGLTITHVVGRGEQGGVVFSSRVGSMTLDEIEKVKIETVIDDGLVEPAVQAIGKAAATGSQGDGRLFILPVEQSMKIREI